METNELRREIAFEVTEPSRWGVIENIKEGLNRLGLNVRISWETVDDKRYILTLTNHTEFDKV